MKRIQRISKFALLAAAATASLGAACSASGPNGDGSSVATAEQALETRPARLYLTASVVARLQQRAAAGDASWTALKARCDGLAGGTFNAPNKTAYPDFPNVGQGYQGDGYLPEIMNLGLCYRVVRGVDATAEAKYGSAGARLLDVMATPVSSGGEAPSNDSGYGIRNYGVGMATGFDWLYPALSSATKTNVINSLHVWIDWYDASGFSNNDPIGNYFAGYLLAKTTAALATEGDDSKSPTYWADVQNRMWTQLVKPKFTSFMKGGGWPEGWQYGPRSVQNVVQFLWAVKTAKGIDWWSEIPQARDQAQYLTHFAWPSLKHMDDQGTVHAQAALTPSAATTQMLAMILEYNGDAYASTARSFAADVNAAASETTDAWQKFMYWDDSLAKTTYTTRPLSYFAQGPNHVAVRSTWQTDAVWSTFVSGQYIDAPDSGEQYFNQGSVAIVVGDQPLLVNATGWLPQSKGDTGEQFVYDDTWANQTRKLNNTFYTSTCVQDGTDPSSQATHIERFEEGGGFVRARGAKIQDMYAHGAVTQFMRDYVYLRPGTFVMYDRTTAADANADQWLAWHTPTQPTQVATSDATQTRYDVAANGATIGSVRTLLPKNATTSTVNLASGGAFRLEAHAPAKAAAQDWLTVVTTGAAVPDQTRLSAGDGNVLAGVLVGVHVKGTRNDVVLFNADHAGAQIASAARYVVAQTATADHVLFDMAPSASGYGVTATVANGQITIDVHVGGSFAASANGTVSFTVTTSGAVSTTGWTAGVNPPPPPQDAGAPPQDAGGATDSGTTSDAGTARDSGTTNDAGTTRDSGTTSDAGTARDSGTTSDAGTARDSGTTNDAGTTRDSGTGSNDSGTTSNDAGAIGVVTTKSFTSAHDVGISSQYLADNGGKGATDTTDAELGCYAVDGYTSKMLVAFDLSSIPANATITSATLSLVVDTWEDAVTLHGSYIATPWDASSSSLGWTQSSSSGHWSTPGVGANDVVANASFVVAGLTSIGDQSKSIALDVTQVQRWVATPSSNHGLLIENPLAGPIVNVHGSADATATNRPKLVVVYH